MQDFKNIEKVITKEFVGKKKSDSQDSVPKSMNSLSGLVRDLLWLNDVVVRTLNSFDNVPKDKEASSLSVTQEKNAYDDFLIANAITKEEKVILLLCISPHIIPYNLNVLKDSGSNKILYPQLGGVLVGEERNFWPTVETALYLLSGENIPRRIFSENYFNKESRLLKNNWISVEGGQDGLPVNYWRLNATQELLSIIKGNHFRPDFSTSFPASYLTTKLDWSDLILPYDTMTDIKELKVWLKYGDAVLKHPELGRKLKPGYRALFYGPPGTGKTLTATLLGKENKLDVYRIDLSMVVSKWVGETEKNLKQIFDLAENKKWILFFDEADSIFGKRTQTSSSNDRYANQEVSYLLQRIEEFSGMIILASNLKNNIDDAFNRRFQSIIYFPMPDAEIRYSLWQNAFPSDFKLDSDIDLYRFAERFELAGGSIINVVRYCVLKAFERNDKRISFEDFEKGIINEYKKKGKIVS